MVGQMAVCWDEMMVVMGVDLSVNEMAEGGGGIEEGWLNGDGCDEGWFEGWLGGCEGGFKKGWLEGCELGCLDG